MNGHAAAFAAILLLASLTAVGEGLERYPALLARIEAFGPRIENGAAERSAFALVDAVCARSGLASRSIDFSEASEGHSFSRIVEARIKGARPDELAVVVSVDDWIDSRPGEGGSAALAFALHEAERQAAASRAGSIPPLSLRFVFLGAERRGRSTDSNPESLGARSWIAGVIGTEPLAVLYLDFAGYPASLRLVGAAGRNLAPLWLYDRARRALESTTMPLLLEANRLQLNRLGLVDRSGPLDPYLIAGIPAIQLGGAGRGEASADEGAWFDDFFDRFLRENEAGFSRTWDRHYFAVQLGRLIAVVGEGSYVAFLVIFSALAIAAILTFSVYRRAGTKILLRRAPIVASQLFALYVVLAVVFLVGSGIWRFDSVLLGSAEAWKLAPRTFAGARIASTFLFFFALLSFLVERRALTPNPYFYEFAALACLAFDIYLFSAIQLPLSFYFAWAFAVVGLSLAVRRPWATLVAYLLMYAPLILLAIELAARPEAIAYGSLIAPERSGIFILAALMLPFFAFTASPLLFYAPHGAIARKRVALALAACGLAVEAGALAYAAFAAPADPDSPPFTLSESIDQDSGEFAATLTAHRRIGRGRILRGDANLEFSSAGDRAIMIGEDRLRRISIREARSYFLDRARLFLDLGCNPPPYSLSVAFDAGDEFHIYDCNFPYKIALDGKSARIYVGINPGAVVGLSLTVPRDFHARLVVSADYLEAPVPYRFEDSSLPRPGRFSVVASTLLRAMASSASTPFEGAPQ